LVVRGHQIKSSPPSGHLYGQRPEDLLENRPLTDSPEKIPSLSALCVSNKSSLEDEWAVKRFVIYFLLLVVIRYFLTISKVSRDE
jgi:hypothetical protein